MISRAIPGAVVACILGGALVAVAAAAQRRSDELGLVLLAIGVGFLARVGWTTAGWLMSGEVRK